MMQFLNVRLGGLDVVFPDVTTAARAAFAFPSEVNTAYSLLQSFVLHQEGSDVSISAIQVSLETYMDATQPRTAGIVLVSLAFTGSEGISFSIDPRLISAEIGILVIGV